MTKQNKHVRDAYTYDTLTYHHREISKLNKAIEEEYIRLAQKKRKHVEATNESFLSKWLGIKYLFPNDDGRVHSCSAFVEFASLTAKQQAIQCNLTGADSLMAVSPVPEVGAIIWENAHVSKRLIDRRKVYANFALVGCLIVWSLLVTLIRSYGNLRYDENTNSAFLRICD